MKIESYSFPESSFLSVEKDFNKLFNLIDKNDRLKKLLYYDTNDCLDNHNLPNVSLNDLVKNNKLRIVPRYKINGELYSGLIVKPNGFSPNGTNPEFRNNVIEFDYICHFDHWVLKDFQLRVIRVAAEIDTLLSEERLTGIGKVEFMGAEPIEINDDYGGICILYQVIHGDEDKVKSLDPKTNEDLIENFNKMFNNK